VAENHSILFPHYEPYNYYRSSPDSSENPFPDMEDMEKIATNSRKTKNRTITRLLLKIARLMLKSTILLWKQIDRKKIGGVIKKIWLISYKVK
jgi:hypothetical protein